CNSADRVTKLTGSLGRSRAIVAVDRNVFLGEIAGQHAVGAAAKTDLDLEGYSRALHRLRHHALVIGRVARAFVRHADAVEPDRELVAVGWLSGLANRHDDAAPIGVLAG